MRKYLRGNSGMRFLAILTAVALTLGSVDVTALASAAGQNAAPWSRRIQKAGRLCPERPKDRTNRRTVESSRA